MVRLKTPDEIALMREAGRRLAGVLAALRREVRPGVRTDALNKQARALIRDAGCAPAFLGYRPHGARHPFPAALCVSINDTVVHGVPSPYLIREGDLVKLDLGLVYHGFFADAAVTVGAGAISPGARALVRVTEEALRRGIRAAEPGNTLGDIGFAISAHVRRHGFSTAEMLTGHGIGRALHEDPPVWNTGTPGKGEELLSGMVLAIEPMVNAGGGGVVERPDDSFATKDGSLSAHFEHTVLITERGPVILTARDMRGLDSASGAGV